MLLLREGVRHRRGRTGQLSPTPGRITSSGVRTLASAPHIEPLGVYFILALSTGKESELESEGIVDATRGRMRPPPPPRRHPITAAVAAITAPIITATPVAITTSECATIDATALSRPLSPDALHGQAHLGTVTTASTVDFQGPPLLQPSPPSPPSSLPPSWPQPPALPSVATCARAFWPSRPQCKKKMGL